MKTFSLRQVCFISIGVAVLTVAAIALFRISPFYPAARSMYLGWHPTRGPRLGDAEVKSMRDTYSRIVEARSGNVKQSTIDEVTRAYKKLRITRNLHWLGIPTMKNPPDAWMTQQIVAEVRPDFIVETGTWRAGSALFFATILEGLGLENSKVITIDIEDYVPTEARNHPYVQKHVEFILASSTDPGTVSRVAERVKGGTVLVYLDSSHAKDHVLNELRAYAPMVTPGSYIIVEDTHLDAVVWPDGAPGPFAAVEEFMGSDPPPPFERDLTREVLMLTFNAGGWLQRIP